MADNRKAVAARMIEVANAYQAAFATEAGADVLSDLRAFCGGTGLKTNPDGSLCPFQVVRAAGRREVLERIVKLMGADTGRLHDIVDERTTL